MTTRDPKDSSVGSSLPVARLPLERQDRERRLALCRQRLKTYAPSADDWMTEPPVMRFYREDVEFLLGELVACLGAQSEEKEQEEDHTRMDTPGSPVDSLTAPTDKGSA